MLPFQCTISLVWGRVRSPWLPFIQSNHFRYLQLIQNGVLIQVGWMVNCVKKKEWSFISAVYGWMMSLRVQFCGWLEIWSTGGPFFICRFGICRFDSLRFWTHGGGPHLTACLKWSEGASGHVWRSEGPDLWDSVIWFQEHSPLRCWRTTV